MKTIGEPIHARKSQSLPREIFSILVIIQSNQKANARGPHPTPGKRSVTPRAATRGIGGSTQGNLPRLRLGSRGLPFPLMQYSNVITYVLGCTMVCCDYFVNLVIFFWLGRIYGTRRWE